MFNLRNPFSLLNQILANQAIIIKQGQQMLQGEKDLANAVAGLTTFAQVAATELTTLQAAVNAATGDPDAEIETLAQQVNTSIATMQAAMPTATVAAVVSPTPVAAPAVGT